jgi:hypothetical protein
MAVMTARSLRRAAAAGQSPAAGAADRSDNPRSRQFAMTRLPSQVLSS